MSTGLHARNKKRDEYDHNNMVIAVDLEKPTHLCLPSTSSSTSTPIEQDDHDHKQHHRRRNPFSRFVRSEVGYAVEVVVGFLILGLFLGYLLLHHQQRKVILHIMHDPVGHAGAALKGRYGFRHHFYTGHPRSATVVMPSVVLPEKRSRRLNSILETWGPAARAVYVVHNVSEFPLASHAVWSETQIPEDPYSYPQLLLLPNSIAFDDGVPRLIYVIRMVYEKVNPDFAFFVNDHTFVIPEHLCKYLEHQNPTDYMYHGHAMKNEDIVFNSGAAGYVLSRETMKKLVHLWDGGDPLCTGQLANKWLQGNPALLITQCMKERLGIVPVDTRHHQKWHRFHAFPLTRVVANNVDEWYKNKHVGVDKMMDKVDESYSTLLEGADCCAQDTISFHYVEYMEQRAMFATREALLKHPHMKDHELKSIMMKEWPNQQKDVGGYSRGLPKENDTTNWEPLLQVMRKISSRHTQREC